MRRCRLVFAVLLAASCTTERPAPPLPVVVDRIAFGSCARQKQPQPIWDAILAAEPDVFLFIGDNVYADARTPQEIRDAYARLAAQPGWVRLRERCPILATWDDHDYGRNDAGAEYPLKRDSQRIFLDFFDVPRDSPRHRREGIYDAVAFGPEGRRVQVLLLDTRWFRSPLRARPPGESRPAHLGRYVPNPSPDATILGDAQWMWLEEQMRIPADLRILCSSIQVISDEHGFESWGNFPGERARLYALISSSGGGTVVVSGDRHHAELSRNDAAGVLLYDLTSSSLNAPRERTGEPNRARVGDACFDANFGLIEVAWDAAAPTVTLEIRRANGEVALRHSVPLEDLRARR